MTGKICIFLVPARYPHSEHASKESDYKNDGQTIVLEEFFHLNTPDELEDMLVVKQICACVVPQTNGKLTNFRCLGDLVMLRHMSPTVVWRGYYNYMRELRVLVRPESLHIEQLRRTYRKSVPEACRRKNKSLSWPKGRIGAVWVALTSNGDCLL